MALPKAILFDHDGVLVESEPLHWAAWEQLLGELGVPYNSSETRSFIGKTAPEIITELLDRHSPGWDRAKLDPHALARRKNDLYLVSAQTQLRLYPGVREGLKWLRAQGVKTAVVSNARGRELTAGLGIVGLLSEFDAVISRDDAGKPKPAPGPYLLGAATLGIDVLDCLAVEDSPPGLEAALLAGMPAAGIMTNFSDHALKQPVPGRPQLRPVWIGASATEFFEWLKSL